PGLAIPTVAYGSEQRFRTSDHLWDVLVAAREPWQPKSHHFIADKLIDHGIVSREYLGGDGVEAIQKLRDVFRRPRFRVRGVAAHVGEKHTGSDLGAADWCVFETDTAPIGVLARWGGERQWLETARADPLEWSHTHAAAG